MTKTEYRHDDVDKAAWGEGPWVDEPDKVVWVDEVTGLDCMIHRNQAGALCGYVGVGPDHPWHGKSYSEVEATGQVDVHGTLTYSDKCNEKATEANGICHVPAPGREHNIWWLGFDCAHQMDVIPGYEEFKTKHPVNAAIHDIAGMFSGLLGHPSEVGDWTMPTYKTIEWVTHEVEALASQIEEAGT